MPDSRFDLQPVFEVVGTFEPEPNLTASGNPTQVRAPEGTSIGGQWIDTPTALMDRARARTTAEGITSNLDASELAGFHQQLQTDFENRTYGDGFTVKVNPPAHIKASSRYEHISVKMDIVKDGRTVGNVQRAYMPDGSVVHGTMDVSRDYRGQGFSTDFSKHSEDVYRREGIDTISLLATMDGGRVWAKAGYQFDKGGTFQVDYARYTAVIDRLTQSGDTGTLDTINDMFQGNDPRDHYAVETDMLIDWGISPQDILNLTDSAGNPIGHDIMQGSSWQGVKHLFPVGEELGLAASGMMTDDWNASRERSDLLFEFCTLNGLDYDAIWDDASEDAWSLLDFGALTAAGNPGQVRAPEGTRIGGQWIETPGGLLWRASDSPYSREQEPTMRTSLNLSNWELIQAREPERAQKAREEFAASVWPSTHEGDLTVQTSPQAALAVLESGAFKNRFQRGQIPSVGHENDRDYYQARKDVETSIGVPEGTPPAERPIYGWFDQGDGATDYVKSYGGVGFTVNDDVKDRSTMSAIDSGWGANVVPARDGFQDYEDMLIAGDNQVGDLFGPNPTYNFPPTGTYVEGQIHGGLKLSDIGRITLDRDYMTPDEFDQLFTAFESTGIPIDVLGGDDWEMDGNLVASAAPTQARAPKGTSTGGQWIDTPGMMLERAKAIGNLNPVRPGPYEGGSAEAKKVFADYDEYTDNKPRDPSYPWTHPPGSSSELHPVYQYMGYDKTLPTIVNSDGIENGPNTMYRGVTDGFDRNGKVTASEVSEQFRTGEHWPGNGMYGDGSYFARDDDYERALNVARNYGSEVNRARWKDDARVLEFPNEISREEWDSKNVEISDGAGPAWNTGSAAALLGYDGYRVWTGETWYEIVLNRGALEVEAESVHPSELGY